jgi:hypothetical protein
MSNLTLDTSTARICQTCGYDLRGLIATRCPECGSRFDPTQLPGARIPWLQRAAIGNWRAYWRTVGMVMFHPREFGDEIWNAPRLDPKAAARFRMLLIGQAMLSTVIVAAALCWGNAPARWSAQVRWLANVESVCVVTLGIFLLIATDLVQEDSWQRTMNVYACAPLALVPFAEIILLVVALAHGPFELASTSMVLLIFGWWWIDHVLVLYVVKRSVLLSVGNATIVSIGMICLAGAAILCGVAAASLVDLVLSQWL